MEEWTAKLRIDSRGLRRALVGAQTRLSALQASVNMDVRCDGVENRGVKVVGVKQRTGGGLNDRGHRPLSAPLYYPGLNPCPG